jgi:hypothetical protein
MGKVQDSMCLSCRTGPEDIFHMWMTYPKLINFKSYLIDILHNVLLREKQHSIMDYQELILHEYMKNTRTIYSIYDRDRSVRQPREQMIYSYFVLIHIILLNFVFDKSTHDLFKFRNIWSIS